MCLMLMLRKRLFTNGFSMRGTFLGSLVVELISLKVGRLLWTLVLSFTTPELPAEKMYLAFKVVPLR
ncbi:hypothetical protein HA466_0228790 [Hirschfeldia incana]|nr:hypothetical protein HA466_0228790 [Hirschfeldia incana]KAJ0240219.1 hypothetical protein HA466_0228790 [Hirschfeldia incana]KAJ0240222.1 hypothetical protein HA466_0228790 [Hirschfeldia incana]